MHPSFFIFGVMVTPQDINLVATIDLSNRAIRVADLTNYGSLGENPAELVGLGVIYDPAGQVVAKTNLGDPLIALYQGQFQSAWYDVTLNTSTQLPLLGTYKIEYQLNKVAPFSGVAAAGDLELAGDVTSDFAPGAIVYVQSPGLAAGFYTVASSAFSSPNTTVTFETPLPLSSGGVTLVLLTVVDVVETELEVCLEQNTIDLNLRVTHSCEAGNLKSKDVTDYTGITLTSRVHRIQFPRYSNGVAVAEDVVSSVLATNGNITISELWTGNYTISVEVAGQKQVNNNFIVLFGSRKVLEYNVVCRDNVLKARNCIRELLKKYAQYCGRNIGTNPLQCVLTQINTHHMLMRMYQQTGEADLANEEAKKIIRLANAHGCNCDNLDGTFGPVLVTAGNIANVFAQLSPLQNPGDLYFRNDQGIDSRLPIGQERFVLTSGASGLPEYQKPQGDVFELNFNNDTVAGATPVGQVTIPADYITEDGEGVEYELYTVAFTPGTSITASINAVAGCSANIADSADGPSIIRCSILRFGAQWRCRLMVIGVQSGVVDNDEVLIPAVGTEGFDAQNVLSLEFDNSTQVVGFRSGYVKTKQL